MVLRRNEADYNSAAKVRKAVKHAMQDFLPDPDTCAKLREAFRKGSTHADHFYKRKEEE